MTKEQADQAAAERVYGRMLSVSPETSEYLDKLPGADLNEKLFIQGERLNDAIRALQLIVNAFDAPHRVKMFDVIVNARNLLQTVNQ